MVAESLQRSINSLVQFEPPAVVVASGWQHCEVNIHSFFLP